MSRVLFARRGAKGVEPQTPTSAEAQSDGMPRRWRRSPARNDVYRGKPDAGSPGGGAGTLGFAAADQWSALRERGRLMAAPTGCLELARFIGTSIALSGRFWFPATGGVRHRHGGDNPSVSCLAGEGS